MNRPSTVGVIGCGGMGASHIRTLHQHCPSLQLTAISDVRMERMEQLAPEVGDPLCFKDPFALIQAVDSVVIASPDDTHAEYVLAALEAGKPVLCEKPLAATVDEAVSILKAEEKLGRKLVSVGFNRRFDPHHVELKKTLDAGTLGRPLLFKGMHRNAQAMYRTDGPFILNNSAGHDVDSARWMLDSSVLEVYCYGIKSRSSLAEHACDLLIVNLLMENGSRAIVEVYVNASYGYEVGLEVVCQEGTVCLLPTQLTLVRFNAQRSSFVSSDFRAYFERSYVSELQTWTESLAKGMPFEGADAWDGYMALLTTNAAGKSLVEGSPCKLEPIQIPSLYRGGR